MKISGTNSCFEYRHYKITEEIGWELLTKTVKKLKFKVTVKNEENNTMTIQTGKTEMAISVQVAEKGGCNILADASTMGFRMFSRQSGNDVNTFFTTLEEIKETD